MHAYQMHESDIVADMEASKENPQRAIFLVELARSSFQRYCRRLRDVRSKVCKGHVTIVTAAANRCHCGEAAFTARQELSSCSYFP